VSVERGALIREGKSKQVWEVVGDPGHVVVHYKDDATAFNGVKHAEVRDKGAVNAALNWHLMSLVEEQGKIPSHLVKRLGEVDQLCRRVDIIPVEVVVRNVVAGSASRRFGLEEGLTLSGPMVEWFYKSDELNDPPMSDCHALLFNWAEQWELEYFRHAALEVNRVLCKFWSDLGVTLVDFKIEFGRASSGQVLLADEITPDGCRLWETATGRKLDKDVFRRDIGDLGDTYREVYQRVFGTAFGA